MIEVKKSVMTFFGELTNPKTGKTAIIKPVNFFDKVDVCALLITAVASGFLAWYGNYNFHKGALAYASAEYKALEEAGLLEDAEDE